MKTNWADLKRAAEHKEHADKVAALQLELQHARDRIEQMEKARKGKVIPFRKAKARAEGDTVRVIIPDTHGAKVDVKALAAVMADIQELDPHEVILLGDHVDCGGHLAQHHVMGYVAETPYSYEEDLHAASKMLDALRKAAPRATVDYIEGNHERRVETWCVTQTLRHSKDAEGLRVHYAPEYRLELAKRHIRYFRQGMFYDGLPIPGVIKRGKCYFFHGFNTAKAATAKTIEKIAGNCVFGHTHRAQSDVQRKVGAGVIGSWNPGCLCELQPLWQHTNPTDWTHGYAVQIQSDNGDFLHLNIPVIDGKSLFGALLHL